jgi:hypothetical protein
MDAARILFKLDRYDRSATALTAPALRLAALEPDRYAKRNSRRTCVTVWY